MSGSLTRTLRDIQIKDILLTERYLGRSPFYAGYWVKKRVDGAILRHAELAHGILLDVGCGLKPYEGVFEPFVDRYIGLEYSPESGFRGNRADLCGDAARLPLADESVDTILCTEVMEHVPDPERTVAEFARVLRPGGTLITTAPFVYPIHDAHDFFRYTPDGLAVIMKRNGLKVEKILPLSGTGLTIAIMINLYCFEIGFLWTKWLYPIGLILRPVIWLLCFAVNISGLVMEKLLPSNHLAFDHLTIASKPSE
jgi:SAM-dependent methyltransferase